jgi:hypothetical protein
MIDARKFYIGGMEEVPKISRFRDVGKSFDAKMGSNHRTNTTGHNRYGSMR